jgi:hypothetical protein
MKKFSYPHKCPPKSSKLILVYDKPENPGK